MRNAAIPCLLFLALASAGGMARADGTGQPSQNAGNANVPSCPDYGSYAVVDGPAPRRGGTISAEPFNNCADLPKAPPRYPVYIGAEVQIGNGTGQLQGQGLGAGQVNVTGQASGSGQIQQPQIGQGQPPRFAVQGGGVPGQGNSLGQGNSWGQGQSWGQGGVGWQPQPKPVLVPVPGWQRR